MKIIYTFLLLFLMGCSSMEIPTNEDITYIYNYVNKQAYDGQLKNKLIIQDLPPNLLGRCDYVKPNTTIIISPKPHACLKDRYNYRLWDTVIHETSHAQTIFEREEHGPLFWQEYRRIYKKLGLIPME